MIFFGKKLEIFVRTVQKLFGKTNNFFKFSCSFKKHFGNRKCESPVFDKYLHLDD